MTVSDFQILIKLYSIDSRNETSPTNEVVHETKFSLKICYSTHVCLAQLVGHQTCKPDSNLMNYMKAIQKIIECSENNLGKFKSDILFQFILPQNLQNVGTCYLLYKKSRCYTTKNTQVMTFFIVGKT